MKYAIKYVNGVAVGCVSGNIVVPADYTEVDEQTYLTESSPVVSESDLMLGVMRRFRDLRAKMCDALGSIAGRMQRAGDTSSALALDAAAASLLNIPAQPSVMSATTAKQLELAIVTEYRTIAQTLTTTSPAAAIEFNKLGLELL